MGERQSLFAHTTMTDTANDILVAAPASNMQVYVDSVTISNTHATTGTLVNFKQGTTTVAMAHFAPALSGAQNIVFPDAIPWGGGNSLEVANATDSSNTNVTVAYHMGST